MTKKKETIFMISQYHCNDGKRSWCEYDPVKVIDRDVYEKFKKEIFND